MPSDRSRDKSALNMSACGEKLVERAMAHPCPMSAPISSRILKFAEVSIPSATSVRSRARASSMAELTIARARRSTPKAWTNDLSILSSSMGAQSSVH